MVFAIVDSRSLWASHGGPEVAIPLGWDQVEHKAFFKIEHHDESGLPPYVIYFALTGALWSGPVQVAWSKEGSSADFESEMTKLLPRLHPFKDESGASVFHYTRVLAVDTLKSEYWGSIVRYRILASDPEICLDSFELSTLVEPSVRMVRRYRIPNGKQRFGILSFRALPYEMVYEVQIPVLLKGEVTQRIEWKRWK